MNWFSLILILLFMYNWFKIAECFENYIFSMNQAVDMNFSRAYLIRNITISEDLQCVLLCDRYGDCLVAVFNKIDTWNGHCYLFNDSVVSTSKYRIQAVSSNLYKKAGK